MFPASHPGPRSPATIQSTGPFIGPWTPAAPLHISTIRTSAPLPEIPLALFISTGIPWRSWDPTQSSPTQEVSFCGLTHHGVQFSVKCMLTVNSCKSDRSRSVFRFSQKPKIEWVLRKLLFLIIIDLDISSHASHFKTFTTSLPVHPDFNLAFLFSKKKIASWNLGSLLSIVDLK